MRIIHTIAEYQEARRSLQGSLGLAPTMGYLHEGHLSLVRRARDENDSCAAWIFVNPLQFGPSEDYERYPRDEARDVALLEQEGVDLLFMPSAEEIYPPGFSTYVEEQGVSEQLEGRVRPGHFRGVATVVLKFFNIMTPSRAYFGQKDAQQVVVLKKLVRDLNLPVELVICPTVREPDGLAMSSRNAYLTPEERAAAPVLYRALTVAQDAWSMGQTSADKLRFAMMGVISSHQLATLDYVSIAHPETLKELDVTEEGALVSGAIQFSKARLVDNVILGQSDKP